VSRAAGGGGDDDFPTAGKPHESIRGVRRDAGDRHAAATRHLFNKLLGQLYHCLQHHQTFYEAKAFRVTINAAA
jgi:hypothetical protein